MKILNPLLCTYLLAGAFAKADENAVSRCPIETGVFRDGGSKFMKTPASGEKLGIEIIRDGRMNTTTPKEYFLAHDFHQKNGQPMKVQDVLRAFEQAEAVLLSKYGMEFLYHISMNPLIVGGNVAADNYAKKASDSKFIARIEVSEVLWCIQQYRAEHGAESGTLIDRNKDSHESTK